MNRKSAFFPTVCRISNYQRPGQILSQRLNFPNTVALVLFLSIKRCSNTIETYLLKAIFTIFIFVMTIHILISVPFVSYTFYVKRSNRIEPKVIWIWWKSPSLIKVNTVVADQESIADHNNKNKRKITKDLLLWSALDSWSATTAFTLFINEEYTILLLYDKH